MGILWAFAPFLVFVIIERASGVTAGLVSGAAVSGALLVREAISRERGVKVLEIGTLILFAGLALYAKAASPAWSIIAVRLRVDSGLLLIILVSIAIRRPFTIQYAREQVSREYWQSPEFSRTNYLITSAWAAAFAVMVAAELVLLYVPSLPPRIGIVVTVLAILGAISFTSWYPKRGHQAPVRG